MNVSARLEGLATLRREVHRMAAAISSVENGGDAGKDVLAIVADVDAKQADQTFASEGAKSGGKWANLTPDYAAWKRRVKPNRKILTFSGTMRDSLRHLSAEGHIARIRGGVIELGTSNRLAPFHQLGTRHMVKRPPVRKSPAQVDNLKRAIAKGICIALGKRTAGPVSRAARRLAAQLRPDPRA